MRQRQPHLLHRGRPTVYTSIGSFTIDLDFVPSEQKRHDFLLTLKGTQGNQVDYNFVISIDQIFAFPVVQNTSKDIPNVTIGNTLTVTTTFLQNVDAFAGSIVVSDQSGALSLASDTLSGTTYVVSFDVQRDEQHTGVITLEY